MGNAFWTRVAGAKRLKQIMANVILPELGEGITQATVACWHVKVGQKVSQDDDIVELVTDKATFCVPASSSGIIAEILVAEGQSAQIGQKLAIIQ